MPRILQPDRKLFGATLALCLLGAVMVFSASAVVTHELGGSGYSFFLRQMICMVLGLGGMFALMNFDYRKLRQPRVIFIASALSSSCSSAFSFSIVRTPRTAGFVSALPASNHRNSPSSP